MDVYVYLCAIHGPEFFSKECAKGVSIAWEYVLASEGVTAHTLTKNTAA